MLLIIRGVIGVVLIGSISGVDWVGTLMEIPEMREFITLMKEEWIMGWRLLLWDLVPVDTQRITCLYCGFIHCEGVGLVGLSS
jgi:hypothetical protein